MAASEKTVWTTRVMDSPVGRMRLCASPTGLTAVLWPRDNAYRVPLPPLTDAPVDAILDAAEQQLTEYFDGTRRVFGLPLDAQGTPFQRAAWAALATIPFGETRTYLDIARQIGNPGAIRAVGAANGRNPLSIIVPCHRVIGTDGTLTGFAGGLSTKAWLLAHEQPEPAQGTLPL